MKRGFDVLRETWSIGWFERVTRHLQIVGTRRGTYRFISAELRVADLFASSQRIEERPITTSYRVVPRIVTVRSAFTDSVIGSVKATRASTRSRHCSPVCARTSRATSCAASTGGRRLASAFR